MTAGRWIRLGVFVTVTTMVLAGLFVVFGTVRFGSQRAFHAEFTDVSGLRAGDRVTVAGVEVGSVSGVSITGRNRVTVDLGVDDSYRPTQGTRALVRYLNLTGDRYLELADGPGDPVPMRQGSTIPVNRTSPALDLDLLLGSFRPLLRAVAPDQVNALSSEVLSVLQGQGATVASLLARTASLTADLADRDQVIGSLITNLNTVLGTVADHRDDFSAAVRSASDLASGLAADRTTVGAALTRIDGAAGTLADLLIDTRDPLRDGIGQLRRTATQLDSGRDTVNSVLGRLPDAYASLSRLGAYGNFFNYYLCGLRVKLTGPDGHDLTLPLIGQTTGRCTPR
ncbi:MCE family protein [Williamsia sp. M5A3_1d]